MHSSPGRAGVLSASLLGGRASRLHPQDCFQCGVVCHTHDCLASKSTSMICRALFARGCVRRDAHMQI